MYSFLFLKNYRSQTFDRYCIDHFTRCKQHWSRSTFSPVSVF